MDENLIIRRAIVSDVPSMLPIEKRCYKPFGWSEADFQKLFTQGRFAMIAELGGVVVGYCVVLIVIDEAEILNLAIDPEYQGKGYGRVLLTRTLKEIQNAAAHTVYLEVRLSNARAQRLYSSLGFQEIGLRKNYYPCVEGREDGRVMAVKF